MLKEILSETYNMEITESEDVYIARDEAGGREVRIRLRQEDCPK